MCHDDFIKRVAVLSISRFSKAMPKSKISKRSEFGENKNTPTSLPQWPALRPLAPTSDLALDTVLDGQILLIRKLFTASLCQQYVSFLSTLPLTTTPGKPKRGDALRVNDRFEVNDPRFAENLWNSTALKDIILGSECDWGGSVCGLNPRIRIYRYYLNFWFILTQSSQLIMPSDMARTNSLTSIVGRPCAYYMPYSFLHIRKSWLHPRRRVSVNKYLLLTKDTC